MPNRQDYSDRYDPWTEGELRDPSAAAKEDWEREVMRGFAHEALAEQRRTRRWGIFFKSLLFVYLVALVVIYSPGFWSSDDTDSADTYTALVEVRGVIADGSDASADRIVSGLRAAFKDKKTAGVVVRINSPGGSPVQSGYINNEIKRLREKYPDTKLYAVVTDLCASGGYYVAVAADEIYVDKASVVGSIGVLMNGFGFDQALDKLGVDRRLYTAGKHKGFLDPFSPENKGEVKHIQSLLDGIHKQFIDVVKAGRGDRLSDNPDLFSGLMWTGEEAIELGLADKIGSASHVAREVIGAEKIRDFTPRPGFWERMVQRFGMALGDRLVSGVGTSFQLR